LLLGVGHVLIYVFAMQKSHLDQTALQGFNQLVSARRSVRSFEPGEPIPKETLERIADAGRWAPSGANSQPWEICIVEESERVRDVASLMASQADRLNEHCKGFPHVHKKHWVHDSVALMVVFVDARWADTFPTALDPDLDATEYEENRSNILLVSVGAAIQNIQLATTAVGLSSAWLSGGGEPQTAEDLQRLLGFPSTHTPYGIVPIGWPRRRAESRWRRPIEEVIHWNEAATENLRSREDIDHYIEKERRHSIYKDAQSRDRHLSETIPVDGEIDRVDDGN
jgi:nitroreductase